MRTEEKPMIARDESLRAAAASLHAAADALLAALVEAARDLLTELGHLALPRVNADVKVKEGFPCFYCGTPLDPDLRDNRDEPHTAFCPWTIAMRSVADFSTALSALDGKARGASVPDESAGRGEVKP